MNDILDDVDIKFDIMDYVRDSNSKFSGFKLLRHLTKYYNTYQIYSAGLTIYNFNLFPPMEALIRSVALTILPPMIMAPYFRLKQKDPVKDYTDYGLSELCLLLEDKMKIDTDYEMIKEAKLVSKTRGLRINRGIPQLVTTKHIAFSAYDKDSKMERVELTQEHPIFTRRYVLSRESKKPKTKLVTEAA